MALSVEWFVGMDTLLLVEYQQPECMAWWKRLHPWPIISIITRLCLNISFLCLYNKIPHPFFFLRCVGLWYYFHLVCRGWDDPAQLGITCEHLWSSGRLLARLDSTSCRAACGKFLCSSLLFRSMSSKTMLKPVQMGESHQSAQSSDYHCIMKFKTKCLCMMLRLCFYSMRL